MSIISILKRIGVAKDEYLSLATIAESFGEIGSLKTLKLNNGNRLSRTNVNQLFDRWCNDYSDVAEILGEAKISKLSDNINNLMTSGLFYEENHSENLFCDLLFN